LTDRNESGRSPGQHPPGPAALAGFGDTARELLAIGPVAGVNLSGLASARGDVHAAGINAAIGRQLREQTHAG